MKNKVGIANDSAWQDQEDLNTHVRHTQIMSEPARQRRLRRNVLRAAQAFKSADNGMSGKKSLS